MDTSNSDQENNNTTQWTTSQQRKLCYRDLLNRVEDIEESGNIGLQTFQDLGEIFREANSIDIAHNITERYEHPEETLLDSMVLSSGSSVLVKCIESVDVNAYSYDSTEFANKIIAYCGNDEEDSDEINLLKLLPQANCLIPQLPENNFVYGTYDLQNLPQPKQKKQRQKQQKERFERKEPERVTSLNKEEQGIDEIVKVLQDVLTLCYERNNENPIKYYDYVIDTSSFSKTVENMFYCSFLVRDGKARIDLDSKNEPVIKPTKKKDLKQFREHGGTNSQMISTITIPQWETFKRDGYIQKYTNKKNK